MRHRCLVFAGALFASVLWATPGPAQTAPSPASGDLEIAARALVPLLADVRRNLDPRLDVGPGSLPPSPFTGRRSTLFAVRVGMDTVELEKEVLDAMDRLVAWNRKAALPVDDRALVGRWLDQLQVKVLARMAATGRPIECDHACVVLRVTNPDTLFGATRLEQREARDTVLLEAFAEAVEPASR